MTLALSTIEPIMRYGWGAAIILGITGTCIIVATISLAAFAFRAIFPLKYSGRKNFSSDKVDTKDDYVSLLADLEAVKNIIGLHYKDFDNSSKYASQQIGEYIKRVEAIEASLAAPKDLSILSSLGMDSNSPKNKFEDLDMKIRALHNSHAFLDKKFDGALSKLVSRADQLQDDTYKNFRKIQEVITAERVYESYNRMVDDINLQAEKLDDPLSKHDRYGEWGAWEADYNAFRGQLTALERFLSTHAGISLNFFEVPTEKYASANWTYNFKEMTDDQKISYKTYRIILGNFLNYVQATKSKLYNATFFNI